MSAARSRPGPGPRAGCRRFSALLAGAALAGAGSWFGKQFAEVDRFIGPLALLAIGSLVVLYIYRVATWKPKTRD